jgi:hypothetical protein
MPVWSQHLLVLLLVAGCVAVIAWQGIATLRGAKSPLGKCCANGCDANAAASTKLPASQTTQKVHFIPVEMLSRRK